MEKQKIVFAIILVLVAVTVALLVCSVSKIWPFKEKEISDSGWPVYDNTEAGFRVNYPPDWRLGEIDESSEDYKRMTLNGSEGEILFDWGGGFGGYCEKWEEVNIKNEKMTVCNRTDQEGRKEIAFETKDLGHLLFSGFAFVNKPITKNEKVVYKILSTLEFYNLGSQPTKKPSVVSEGKVYTNNQLKISFKYPVDWIVKEENEVDTMELCDYHFIDPTRYPKASVKFGGCGASDVAPTTSITFYWRLLSIRPESSLKESYYPNPAIQLAYYENNENLSIQNFSDKYLSISPSGDPVNIWAPTYETVTNPNGINAYYDKEHYCVATCQIYVWSHANKIFILKNFSTDAVNQDKIFHQVFNTFKFIE